MNIPKKTQKIRILGCIGFLLLSVHVAAEHTTTHVVPPSAEAGVLERTIEKEYEAKPLPPKREIPLLEIDMPEEQLNLDSRTIVFIENIEIENNTIFKTKTLRKLISSYENRKLTMKDILDICAKIREHYAQHGYFLARAYPPVQNIKNKTLKISVLEGKLGKITVEGNKHYSEKFIFSYFKRYLGKPLNYDDFFKSLMIVNENLDLLVGAIFEKGQTVGTADVILRVNDHRPLNLYLDSNNYGASSTSLYRSGGRIDYGNLFLDGDIFSIAEVLGSPVDSLSFTSAVYSFPLTKSGLSSQVSYLYSKFKVNQFTDLRLRGRSEIASAQVAYKIQRTRVLSTDVYGSFDYKQIHNFSLGKTTSSDRLRVARLGFDINYYDSLKGNNYADFSVHQGIPDFLGGSSSVSKASSREGAGGLFTYCYLDYKRIQTLPASCFFIFNLAGQYSFYKLPVPEQFYIGGIDTVRGFPLAVLLGDNGYYLNAEFRLPPPCPNARFFNSKRKWKEVFQFLVFVDNGGVDLKSKEEPLSKGFTNLTSTGAGLRLYGPYHIDVNFDVGIPLSNHHRSSDSIWYWKVNLTF